jgi:hypothetical protein
LKSPLRLLETPRDFSVGIWVWALGAGALSRLHSCSHYYATELTSFGVSAAQLAIFTIYILWISMVSLPIITFIVGWWNVEHSCRLQSLLDIVWVERV